MTHIETVGSIKSQNQNYHFDGIKTPDRSTAFTGKGSGRVNAEVGGRTANYEELAFGLGVVRNYFKSFFDSEENPFVGFIVRALTGSSDFLEGKRDQEMYGEIYGHGVDELSDKNPQDIKTENDVLGSFSSSKDSRLDDYTQNKVEEGQHGERLVARFGEWSTQLSKIKPLAHFITGSLGGAWKMGVQTLLDLPARVYWRIRFFTKSLHSNFPTAVWDLTRLKVMSLFGNSKAAMDYSNKVKELGKMSEEYLIAANKDHKKSDNAGLGSYFKMLTGRMSEHISSITDPKKALERKVKEGFLKQVTDKDDPTQTFENGYVDLDNLNHQKEQRRLGIVDFTGPICAGLGLLGTVVFDPLKMLWGAAGIEGGKDLICALSSSRKSLSLINYVYRFIIPEMNYGGEKDNKKLEELMKSESGPNKAISELYFARKARRTNGLIGMIMAAGNICEPILQLKRGVIGESKFGNFLVDSVMNFNDTFFLRFFSKRRETMGREEYLKSMIKEKLGKQNISIEDIAAIKDQDFENIMKGRAIEQVEQGFPIIDNAITWCTDKLDRVKKSCTGENVITNSSASSSSLAA